MWWGSERGLPPDAHQWCGKAAGAPREPLKSVGTAGALPTIGGSSLGASELHKTARARNPAFSRVGGQCLRGACCAAESCRCLFDSGDENSASMMPVVRILAAVIVLGLVENAPVHRSPTRSRRHVSCDWSQGALIELLGANRGEAFQGVGKPCHVMATCQYSQCSLDGTAALAPMGYINLSFFLGYIQPSRWFRRQQLESGMAAWATDSSGALVYVAPRGNLLPGPGLRAKCVLSNRASVVVYAVATAAARAGSRLSLTYTTSQQPVASYERLQGWEVAEATVRNATYHSDEQSIYWWLSVTKTHRGRKPDYVTRPARASDSRKRFAHTGGKYAAKAPRPSARSQGKQRHAAARALAGSRLLLADR
ncbi:hypothetical protein HPB51_017574 [Rhipicephalus microplus]|uniref:Uncharacterized protein n=1 Tax=Rhipicephalus microplus TaxID=6941 RepID=A0A9J6F4N2_RHIMP|nr:hypothetical protein HPB51_017574 [Rhipicephalus microplus]